MNDFADRLKEFMRLKKLTSSELASLLNIQRSSISHLLSGRNKPSYDFFNKFLEKFPDVNPYWLITGKGEPFENQKKKENKIYDDPEGASIVDSYLTSLHLTEPEVSELIKIFDDGTFKILKRRR